MHYTIAFGLALRLAGAPLQTAAYLYRSCGLRNQISVDSAPRTLWSHGRASSFARVLQK
jgi:hypothetical protein